MAIVRDLARPASELDQTYATPNRIGVPASQQMVRKPFSNSVYRTIASVESDHVNLLDFHIGDPLNLINGVDDCGPAFRKAIENIRSVSSTPYPGHGKKLRLQLPAGQLMFRTGDPTNANVYGALFDDMSGFTVEGAGRLATVITAVNDPAYNIGLFTMRRCTHFTFSDFTLDGRRPALIANGTHLWRGQGLQDGIFDKIELWGKDSGGYVIGLQNNYDDAFDSSFKRLTLSNIWLHGGVGNDGLDIKDRLGGTEGIKLLDWNIWGQGSDKALIDLRGMRNIVQGIHMWIEGGDQVRGIRMRPDGDSETAGVPDQRGGNYAMVSDVTVRNTGSATESIALEVVGFGCSADTILAEELTYGVVITAGGTPLRYAHDTVLQNVRSIRKGTKIGYGISVNADRASIIAPYVEGHGVGIRTVGDFTRVIGGRAVSNTTNYKTEVGSDATLFALCDSYTPVTAHYSNLGTNTRVEGSPTVV